MRARRRIEKLLSSLHASNVVAELIDNLALVTLEIGQWVGCESTISP